MFLILPETGQPDGPRLDIIFVALLVIALARLVLQ